VPDPDEGPGPASDAPGELDHANAWTSSSGNLCIPTTDGRHLSVNGRLWRTTDPRLSEERQAELRKRLMRGMRMKAAGQRREGAALVQDAKLRLGERGTPWWELDRPYDVDHEDA
jgi:hypothetical protein